MGTEKDKGKGSDAGLHERLMTPFCRLSFKHCCRVYLCGVKYKVIFLMTEVMKE